MRTFIFLKSVILALIVAAVASCDTLNTKIGGVFNADTDLYLTITADSDVNPDDNKRPSPLIVRMYELKDTKKFSKTNFIDMFEKDTESLGDEMVDKQRLRHIEPGEVREVKFVLNKDTKYVGLFAEFLRYRKSKYKLVFPVAQTNVVGSQAKIQISGNRMIFVE